jgi:VWFA-related protein
MDRLSKLASFTVVMATLLAFSSAGAQQSSPSNPQPTQSSNDDQLTIKKDVNVVSLYFTVRDSHKRLISDLTQSQFRVLEDGREQQIKFFAHHSDVPLNVGILLDTGTSMGYTLSQEADGSSLFLQRVLRARDLGFIVSYSGHVETLQGPTSDVALLKQQAQTIKSYATVWQRPHSEQRGGIVIGGGGPQIPSTMPAPQARRDAHLYDAVRISTNRYLKREVGRKALLIVALSDDSRSESTLEDALDALQQSDVVAYVMQVYDGPHDWCDVAHVYAADKLKRLAEETGGRVIEVRGMDKMAAAFDEISEELHNQYSLGYYPANGKWDGKYRKIQVESRDHALKVYARRGYYAIPPSER